MLEDFAELDIEDESGSSTREDRMRAAFEQSKVSYAHEQVYTEPGWYDPLEIPPPTKLHIQNVDFSLNNLYLSREYSKALELALSQIEMEENNSFGGEGREFQLVDLAIRCALRIGDNELAGKLSDKTRRKWSSNVGLAATSAEAYFAASRPRDALSAILTAISIRGPQAIYVPVLYNALEQLSQELQNPESLEPILRIVKAHMMRQTKSSYVEVPIVVDEAIAKTWLEKCAITGTDQQRLLTLLCYKQSYETEGAEGRSVRTM